MNESQIKFIKSLDPEKLDGTIQSFLMQPNLNQISFEIFSRELLKRIVSEKNFLVNQNIELWRKINGSKNS